MALFLVLQIVDSVTIVHCNFLDLLLYTDDKQAGIMANQILGWDNDAVCVADYISFIPSSNC